MVRHQMVCLVFWVFIPTAASFPSTGFARAVCCRLLISVRHRLEHGQAGPAAGEEFTVPAEMGPWLPVPSMEARQAVLFPGKVAVDSSPAGETGAGDISTSSSLDGHRELGKGD